MDKGEFAKSAIKIEPLLNGSYIVSQAYGPYENAPRTGMVAFSDFRDLLTFLISEYEFVGLQGKVEHGDMP